VSNQWHPEGGSGGLPSDMLSSQKIGQRRLKTSSRNELAELIEDGLAYSFTGSYAAADSEVISINLSFSSDVFLRRITANPDFKIEVFDEAATGSADGILAPHNLNLVSGDVSPASAQIFYGSTPQGNRLEVGYSEIDPFVFADETHNPSIAITNNSGTPATVDFVIIYEEVGDRAPLFGLTPSTQLLPTTEMSQYG
jgi:hypothetical protein